MAASGGDGAQPGSPWLPRLAADGGDCGDAIWRRCGGAVGDAPDHGGSESGKSPLCENDAGGEEEAGVAGTAAREDEAGGAPEQAPAPGGG